MQRPPNNPQPLGGNEEKGSPRSMKQSLLHVALVVRDYDEAIEFFCGKLHFELIEDSYQPEQDKRWITVAPPQSDGTTLLLARASTSEQEMRVGNQTGGRVFLFLSTDDFKRDYDEMRAKGIRFVRKPKVESYGTVAVFEDLYGNRWDLIEPIDGDADQSSAAAASGVEVSSKPEPAGGYPRAAAS